MGTGVQEQQRSNAATQSATNAGQAGRAAQERWEAWPAVVAVCPRVPGRVVLPRLVLTLSPGLG